MSIFTDYALRRNQPRGAGQAVNELMAGQQPVTPQQPVQQPQIDSSNAIGSLATLLGPTPAEREARERRALENKSKMQAWTGLFDGLRQLGNLYYTTKGATPQQLSSPYQAVDQQYQQQRAFEDANDQYARQYATSLYNLRRQMSDDARKDILAKAQADYYGTRDEVARMKAENDRLKTEKYVELQDGRIAKINAETGKIEQLLPYNIKEAESRINKNNKQASIIGAPVTTTTNSPKGTTTSVRTYGGSGGSKNRRQKRSAPQTSKTYDNTKKLGL